VRESSCGSHLTAQDCVIGSMMMVGGRGRRDGASGPIREEAHGRVLVEWKRYLLGHGVARLWAYAGW
jgi:hypothetical protein